MGSRAQGLFAEQGIRTVVGVPAQAPEDLVAAYVADTLQAGDRRAGLPGHTRAAGWSSRPGHTP